MKCSYPGYVLSTISWNFTHLFEESSNLCSFVFLQNADISKFDFMVSLAVADALYVSNTYSHQQKHYWFIHELHGPWCHTLTNLLHIFVNLAGAYGLYIIFFIFLTPHLPMYLCSRVLSRWSYLWNNCGHPDEGTCQQGGECRGVAAHLEVIRPCGNLLHFF